MIKEVTRAIETGLIAEIALGFFLLAFCLILFKAFSMKKESRTAAKNIPLNDGLNDV